MIESLLNSNYSLAVVYELRETITYSSFKRTRITFFGFRRSGPRVMLLDRGMTAQTDPPIALARLSIKNNAYL
jgi:hypothetical protein